MNYKTIIGIVIVVILAIWGISSYNSLVAQNQSVEQAWAQVENQYQRRADLIPNLVATVKGAAEFQESTFTQVAEARSRVASIDLSGDELTQENLDEFMAAQRQLSRAIRPLMNLNVERYPNLNTAVYQDLMTSLEGTANRITVARMRFNRAVQDYNTNINKFPTNIFAGLFGFEQKAYFEAEAGAAEAPEVEF